MVTAALKLKDTYSLEGKLWQTKPEIPLCWQRSVQHKQWFFPVVTYRYESWDHKEGWVPKNRCFQLVVLEKTLESPLDSKEIKLGDPKGNQPWIFIGRTDAKAAAPILWSPDAKSQLIRKDPGARKDWGQEEKGAIEGEIVGCIITSVYMSLSKLWEIVKDKEAWHAAFHGITKSQTWLINLKTTIIFLNK